MHLGSTCTKSKNKHFNLKPLTCSKSPITGEFGIVIKEPSTCPKNAHKFANREIQTKSTKQKQSADGEEFFSNRNLRENVYYD